MHADSLWVVGCYYNPRRSQTRYSLCRQWVQDSLDSGVNLILVQHTFGEREHAFRDDGSDSLMRGVQLVSLRGGPEQEVWLQHALYNAGFARAPEYAKYFCWEDTDIKHVRKDWASETVEMLQHYRVGQTWTHSMDLGPMDTCLRNEWGNDVDRSFCAAWIAGDVSDDTGTYAGPRSLLPRERQKDYRAHSGYSWAIRRDALRGIGRLIDWEIIGSADYHMARAFGGILNKFPQHFHGGYIRRLKEFQRRCDNHIKQDIGVVPGTILAGWHGHKTQRFYGKRGEILVESQFDPDNDITYDVNGLPTLTTDNRLLRDGIRRYNMMREDQELIQASTSFPSTPVLRPTDQNLNKHSG